MSGHAPLKILYVGIEPPTQEGVHFVHYPLICTTAFPHSDPRVQKIISATPNASHCIITSKEAAKHFFNLFSTEEQQLLPVIATSSSSEKFSEKSQMLGNSHEAKGGQWGNPTDGFSQQIWRSEDRSQSRVLHQKTFIAVGKKTALQLHACGAQKIITATNETQEGIVELLKTVSIDFCIWPHSALSRPLLRDFLIEQNIPHEAAAIYDTIAISPKEPPPLDAVNGIFFSSPSTVEAFISLYGSLPKDLLLIAQGPITAAALTNSRYAHADIEKPNVLTINYLLSLSFSH